MLLLAHIIAASFLRGQGVVVRWGSQASWWKQPVINSRRSSRQIELQEQRFVSCAAELASGQELLLCLFRACAMGLKFFLAR